MKWWNKLDEFQSEMYGKLVDYVRKNGNNELVKYNEDTDMLYFAIEEEGLNEYEVSLYDVAEIVDMLGIKCDWGD